MFHGHKLDVKELLYELGDVLWYLAVISEEVGVSFEHVALMNIAKLKDRYPAGFNEVRSQNRKEYEDSDKKP
jgi:NTP pyrophosphatase (non-canonical NTP hydrolase)